MTSDHASVGPDERPSADLFDYLRVFYRHRVVILVCCILGAAAAALYSYSQPNEYQASATVLYQPQVETALLNINPNIDANPTQALPDQVQLITSPAVASRVRDKLGSADPVQAQVVGATDDLQILVTASSPQRAAAEANAYANSYILTLGAEIRGLFKATIRGLGHEIGRIDGQLASLDAEIGAARAKDGASSGRVAMLSEKRNTLLSQVGNFEDQLTQLQLDLSVETGGASLAASAKAPSSPVSPAHWRDVGLGGVGGGLLGLGAALLLGRLDDTVASRADLEHHALPVPTLAAIPVVAGWRESDAAFLVAAEAPEASSTESYRSLRTALYFIRRDRGDRVFEVTSPSSAEGKTTTVANLGVVMASTGTRTLLLDADLRRPRLHEFFRLDNETGLTSVLADGAPLDGAIHELEEFPNLSVLSSGPTVPNPAEWLGSKHLEEVMSVLRERYEVVIVDSAPVLPVTDATLLSAVVDSTIVVVASRQTTRRAARLVLDSFRRIEAPIAGFVLNQVTQEALYGSGYAHYYRYVKDSHLPGHWLRRPWRQPAEAPGEKKSDLASPSRRGP